MPARGQELALGIGFHTQTALQTALAAGSLWTLPSSEFVPAFPNLVNETDAEDYNKGHEWPDTIIPSHSEGGFELPYFLTSEHFCQAITFGCGDVVKAEEEVAAAWSYTCEPIDHVADGVDLPATTIVSGIRQNVAGEILDMALVGAVCGGFTLRLSAGPGRQNSQLRSRWFGCGKYTNNSGLTIPALETIHRLGAGSATALTILGVDYLTNARFVECEYEYANNQIMRYYPGSGVVGAYDIAGQGRFGNRNQSFRMVVELEANSDELANLLAGTEGTVVITLQGPLISGTTYHLAQITLHRVVFTAYNLVETDGFVAASVIGTVMQHSSNGTCTMLGHCAKDEIGEAA